MGALLFRQLLPLHILFILPLRDAALLVTRLPWPEGGTKVKSKNKRNHLKVCDWLPIAASSLSSSSVTDPSISLFWVPRLPRGLAGGTI